MSIILYCRSDTLGQKKKLFNIIFKLCKQLRISQKKKLYIYINYVIIVLSDGLSKINPSFSPSISIKNFRNLIG